MSLRQWSGAILCVATLGSFRAPAQAPPADAFQTHYATNLNIADSFVNITNVGLTQTALSPAPGTTSNICVNVYTFDPDEQLISCCSCLVKPNGVVSLSARQDLMSNTLTPASPSTIVVKLLSTQPAITVGNNGTVTQTCNAAQDPLPFPPWITTTTIAGGMRAWGTTVKALPTGGYSVTESPFAWSTPTTNEAFRTTRLCGFIQDNGSGFGICKTCQRGALGAVLQ